MSTDLLRKMKSALFQKVMPKQESYFMDQRLAWDEDIYFYSVVDSVPFHLKGEEDP